MSLIAILPPAMHRRAGRRAAAAGPGAHGSSPCPAARRATSATSATGRSSTYISRHTSRSGLPSGPSAATATVEVGPGQRRSRPGRPAWPGGRPATARPRPAPRARQGPGGGAAARPAGGRSPTASRRGALGPVATRAAPDREERLLQHVLHVGRGQHRAQPGRQPRRVPAEQLPQRRVVAGRYPGDQLVVVHCLSIAPRDRPVHVVLANGGGIGERGRGQGAGGLERPDQGVQREGAQRIGGRTGQGGRGDGLLAALHRAHQAQLVI